MVAVAVKEKGRSGATKADLSGIAPTQSMLRYISPVQVPELELARAARAAYATQVLLKDPDADLGAVWEYLDRQASERVQAAAQKRREAAEDLYAAKGYVN